MSKAVELFNIARNNPTAANWREAAVAFRDEVVSLQTDLDWHRIVVDFALAEEDLDAVYQEALARQETES